MYKLILGADIGNDNGIFDWGVYFSVEDAIVEVASHNYHCFYGSEVIDESGDCVAAINGDGCEDGVYYWHCPLDGRRIF